MQRYLFFVLAAGLVAFPTASEAYRVEVSGWVPWWADKAGTERAVDEIRTLDTVYPFVFEVTSDGELVNKVDFSDKHWRTLFRRADRARVEVIPTIAWFDGAAIHAVLRDRAARRDHVEAIADMVDEYDFDGVNIDYESKLAETKDFYSLFLEELSDELGRRQILTCTVEARTPPESRWRDVPRVIEYANDYAAIDTHCDRIELMAYDQQRIDWRLNTEKRGQPYVPVADVDWVEKVVALALEDFDNDKVVLGVPTYGREWTLTVAPEWYKDYTDSVAINPTDVAFELEKLDVKPFRNQAGELSYSYFPDDSPYQALAVLPVPESTPPAYKAVAQAYMFATATNTEVPVTIGWYSDAGAIEDKLDLAERFSLRGVALFKIDGEEDEDIWELF